jgi:NADPH:quinone reductase-like Zn-dependent oxidoreductase
LKAIYLTDFGGPEVLELRESPKPDIRPHDLMLAVRAAGVNRADLSYRKGAYGRANFGDSDLMGLEIAGDVIEVGNEVKGFALGDRVMGIVGEVDMRRSLASITEWPCASPKPSAMCMPLAFRRLSSRLTSLYFI